MKTYPRLLTKLFAEPLMLHEPARQGFETFLLQRMAMGTAGEPPEMPVASDGDAKARRMQQVYQKVGRLAVIRIHGAIDKDISELEMQCFGGCDLMDIDRAISAAAADMTVDTVLLDINSPGGSVVGVPETALKVAALRESKDVYAFTETMMCSAAYYIGSQAARIVSTYSAIVGSIGVYMALLDQSRALEMEGYHVNLVQAGKLKTAGSPFKPLEEHERAFFQESVNRTWNEFRDACTSLRDIDEESMQGQWFSGTEASERGLVDELTTMSAEDYADTLVVR
jgi:signal peptide peptidase SppA